MARLMRRDPTDIPGVRTGTMNDAWTDLLGRELADPRIAALRSQRGVASSGGAGERTPCIDAILRRPDMSSKMKNAVTELLALSATVAVVACGGGPGTTSTSASTGTGGMGTGGMGASTAPPVSYTDVVNGPTTGGENNQSGRAVHRRARRLRPMSAARSSDIRLFAPPSAVEPDHVIVGGAGRGRDGGGAELEPPVGQAEEQAPLRTAGVGPGPQPARRRLVTSDHPQPTPRLAQRRRPVGQRDRADGDARSSGRLAPPQRKTLLSGTSVFHPDSVTREEARVARISPLPSSAAAGAA
jgi:hypothetical protein